MSKRIIIPQEKVQEVAEMKKAEEKARMAPPPPSANDLLFSSMLDRCRTVLHREIGQLFIESQDGKLSKDSAQNLRDYVKLLKELIDKESSSLQNLSDEQLEAISNEDK